MYKILLVLGFLSVVACSSGFESQGNRPYTVGPTSGDFKPVSPKKMPIKIKGPNNRPGPKKQKQDKKQKVEKTALNKFAGLNFVINLDESEVEGEKQLNAKVRVNLGGTMLVYGENSAGKIEQQKKVKLVLKKTYNRFSSVDDSDTLEDKEHWLFELADARAKVFAKILCLNKWSCKTVVANIYWYEGKTLYKKQYHVENTFQPTRVEPEIITEEEEDHDHKHEDVAEHLEVDIHIDEKEEEAVGESSDYLYFPIAREEEKLEETPILEQGTEDHAEVENLEVITEKEEFVEQVTEDIVSQIEVAPATEASENVFPMSNYSQRVNIGDLVFDFNSVSVTALASYQLPTQAMNCQATKASAGCASGGSLKNADRLEDVNLSDLGNTLSPYVIRKTTLTKSYGTSVLVNLVKSVATAVNDKYGRQACIGNLSRQNGGLLDPSIANTSKSHQNGLDIDYYFYTKDSLSTQNCVFNAIDSKTQAFDLERNYYFLTELYKKAQAEDSNGQKFSYLYNIFLDKNLKQRLCKHIKDTEGPEALEEGAVGYEVMRRIFHVNGHADHYHIRLNCHGVACRDYGFTVTKDTGCH